jgi:uroporphyrinogen-III synthase
MLVVLRSHAESGACRFGLVKARPFGPPARRRACGPALSSPVRQAKLHAWVQGRSGADTPDFTNGPASPHDVRTLPAERGDDLGGGEVMMGDRKSRVWVTRARPGAEASAERLRELGFEPVVSPVLEVRPLPVALDTDAIVAIAFTSANAVRAFARLEPGRAWPVFAVGQGTARAAREAGFADVYDAAGDVRALARRLAEAKPAGRVLNPTAAEPAADLSALLAGSGVEVRSVPVYETIAVEPAEALAALDAISAVLVHSPKAAAQLAARLDPASLARLDFACISEAAARPLAEAGARSVRSAPFPTEADLLKLLAPIRA